MPASIHRRRVGLSQIRLTVSDVGRSLDFYQGLFGMPVQARQGSTVLLRIGDGPRFLCLQQAAKGESPSISALGFGVQDFTDPDGLAIQLQDVRYCGGGGVLGEICPPLPSARTISR